jgi:hypothetical protein
MQVLQEQNLVPTIIQTKITVGYRRSVGTPRILSHFGEHVATALQAFSSDQVNVFRINQHAFGAMNDLFQVDFRLLVGNVLFHCSSGLVKHKKVN